LAVSVIESRGTVVKFNGLILGAGLVSVKSVIHFLPTLGMYVAQGVEPVPENASLSCSGFAEVNAPIALAVLGYFFFSGVMYGYLWSRWEFAVEAQMPDTGKSSLGTGDLSFAEHNGVTSHP
jgi:hypothetical protein